MKMPFISVNKDELKKSGRKTNESPQLKTNGLKRSSSSGSKKNKKKTAPSEFDSDRFDISVMSGIQMKGDLRAQRAIKNDCLSFVISLERSNEAWLPWLKPVGSDS